MAVAHSKSVRGATREGPRLAIADLVLLRVATGGATRAQLQKDLSALVAPKAPCRKDRLAVTSALPRPPVIATKRPTAP